MRFIDAVQYISPTEINEPYMEPLAQKLRKVGGGYTPEPVYIVYRLQPTT